MSAVEVIAEALRIDADDVTDSWSAKVWPHRAKVALDALKAAGIAVVELPKPFQIDITEIDMEPPPDCWPECDCEPDCERDDRARLVIRFKGSTMPGGLFDRDKLAAALLAANAAEAQS